MRLAQRMGKSALVALDWKQAFDSINPQAMVEALRCFGIKGHVLGIVSAVYTGRQFQVRDCGVLSEKRVQAAGTRLSVVPLLVRHGHDSVDGGRR